jgi:predicted transcriptional regulator YdeE
MKTDTRIEDIGPIELIGVAMYGNPEVVQFSNAWNLFGEIADESGIMRIGNDLFGLQIYHPMFPKRFELTYMPSILKEPGTEVPIRMLSKSIPASRYVVQKVEDGVSGIDNTLIYLYRQYIPENGLSIALPIDFEKYCNIKDHESVPDEIEVWVPVK